MDEQDRPLHRAAAQRCDLRRFLLLRPLQAGAQLLQFLCAVRFQQGGVSGKFSLCLHGRLSVRPRQGKDAGDIPHFLFLQAACFDVIGDQDHFCIVDHSGAHRAAACDADLHPAPQQPRKVHGLGQDDRAVPSAVIQRTQLTYPRVTLRQPHLTSSGWAASCSAPG